MSKSEQQLARYHKNRSEFLADKCCVRCESTTRLEIDHIDRTQKTSHYIWNWSKERRDQELAKCQVLCRLCHQKKTIEERGHVLGGRPRTKRPRKHPVKVRPPSAHGTLGRYFKGKCRCEACVEVGRAYNVAYYERTRGLKVKRRKVNR